jgi:hypothetical protein
VPIDDASVYASMPTSNLGDDERLETDGEPEKLFLAKFAVTGVGPRSVLRATLRLYAVDASSVGGSLRRVADNSWSESSVTWDTAPSPDAAELASLGEVVPGNWYQVDLTPLVTGDGAFTLAVVSTAANGADYSSKEGANAPELVVTVSPE